jgi:hypothetical protein
MVSRRTWARIQFLTTLLSLPSQLYQWRTAEEDGDSVPLALRWLLAGSVFQTIYYWAYDRDLGDIRTNYWRRPAVGDRCGTYCQRLSQIKDGAI